MELYHTITFVHHYHSKARTETGKFLRSTIVRYYNDADAGQPDAVNLVWNQLMTEMQCCGVNDYHDFAAADKWIATKGGSDIVLPKECCKRLVPANNGSALLDAECPSRPTAENSNFMTVSQQSISFIHL